MLRTFKFTNNKLSIFSCYYFRSNQGNQQIQSIVIFSSPSYFISLFPNFRKRGGNRSTQWFASERICFIACRLRRERMWCIQRRPLKLEEKWSEYSSMNTRFKWTKPARRTNFDVFVSTLCGLIAQGCFSFIDRFFHFAQESLYSC